MKTIIGLLVLLLPGLAFAANSKREDPIERAIVAAGMVVLLFVIAMAYSFFIKKKTINNKKPMTTGKRVDSGHMNKTDRANMKTFRVFKHPTLGFQAIKSGFSWPAFFFQLPWLFVKKLWMQAFIVLFLMVIVGIFEPIYKVIFEKYFNEEYMMTNYDIALLQLCLALFQLSVFVIIGFKGNNWRVTDVQNKGYQLVDTVSTTTPEAAIAMVVK